MKQKIFAIYLESEEEATGYKKQLTKKAATQGEALVSLQDMIDDMEWSNDSDRYYELKLSLLQQEARQEERVITQILKQEVTYME